MKTIIELKAYEKSVYKMFGMFPFLLMIISCIGAYLYAILTELYKTGEILNTLDPLILSNAFFRGVVISAAVFIFLRYNAVKTIHKSSSMSEMAEQGNYISCMSHGSWKEMTFGNLIIMENRFYFQPDRQLKMTLEFDHRNYEGFTLEVSEPMKSIGLYLITGEKQMIIVKNAKGNVVGRFIAPQPKETIDKIKAVL